MRGLITLTQLLVMPFLGLIVGSAIMESDTVGLWICLLILDVVLGITFQYLHDRSQPTEQEIAEYVNFIRNYAKNLPDEQEAKKVNAKEKFFEIYNMLQAEGGARLVRSLQEEEAGQFLRTVCSQMPYAPAPRWLVGARAVCVEKWDETPVILYIFDNERWEICQNCYVILANTRNDGLRFFCVEADSAGWMLCEYHNGSHINYGVVDLKVLPERVKEILKKPVDNLPF